MPRRTQHRIQPQIKMRNGIAKKDNLHIIARIPHSLVTAAEEVKNRVEECHYNHRKSHTQQNIQHKYIAQYPLRRVIVLLPELDGNQRSRSHTYQRTESRCKVHQGESQRQSRNSHCAHTVTDEDTVHHII